MNYQEFLRTKAITHVPTGQEIDRAALDAKLFDFQRDLIAWSARKGRSAIFADCGLGKTPMQLQWAQSLGVKTLILAPLAVGKQTVREGEKFGVEVVYSREPSKAQITITNYEMLEHFDADDYQAIILDESSIIKHFEGKLRNLVIDRFRKTPYRLACTATPAPNDFMELGNHSEFLGNLTRTEMLSTFFIHDGGDTAKWRLKGHAVAEFWKWVCSWAVMLRKPSDLGYDDGAFMLPELRMHQRQVDVEHTSEGMLFAMPAVTMDERRKARSESIVERSEEIAQIVASKKGQQCLVWCNLNSESAMAAKLIPDSVEVAGAHSREFKEEALLAFSQGKIKTLISKPSICGFGLNFQSCHNVLFLGLNDSYEQFYQAIRRCWRFGQEKPVDCYLVTSTREGEVVKNIQRKEADAQRMAEEMVNNMHDLNTKELKGQRRETVAYKEHTEKGQGWEMRLGDCCEVIKKVKSDTIHYSIYSPPFASLYTYSASDRDMGNSRTHAEFFEHMRFLAPEILRVLMPGRLMSFHCMNLPTSKERDGVIGLTDFRGDLIRIFREAGFIFHSEVAIWKDPVTAMQRTKALGLLHKQLKKDSCMSRQGIPDYLVTMRKPGDNPERVTHTNESFPVQVWQRFASPVWMDINPSDTLQKESAREEEDERHICPLQLEVIARGIELWTNPGDIVMSPFAGIGSEGYEAIKADRRFLGMELKESYFKQAVGNLRAAQAINKTLFSQEKAICKPCGSSHGG